MQIVAFAPEHATTAAALLAERHARHRAVEPFVPDVDEPAGEGVVALEDGEVTGYLVGERRESDAFGRHVWIGDAGFAARDPEVLRDLYAAAAEPWVEAGHTRHFVLTPALADLVAVWFSLGFGQQQVHAVRASGGRLHDDIRLGGPEDLEAAAPLRGRIWDHQALSPVFAGVTRPSDETMRADWEEGLAEPDVTYFVAERDGRLLGHALVYPRAGTLYLAVAATLPEARGTGVGVALTEHVLAWAAEQGYESVITDWRATNLLSSRFWPRRGFRPTFLRLCRSIP